MTADTCSTHIYLPSGKHCCLWCEITTDQLIVPLSVRGRCMERSLDSLRAHYDAFVAAGADLQKAKHHHNVIAPFFFRIPLDQVG